MHYLSVGDLHLWSRCRRQWFHRCLGNGIRRAPIPEGMTGESSLREGARAAASGRVADHGQVPDLWDESIARPDADPTLDAYTLVNDSERLLRWWARTEAALAAGESFRSGVVLSEGLYFVIDAGRYRERLETWEFYLYRAATGIRGSYRTEGGALALILQELQVPAMSLHLCYLNKRFRLGANEEPLFLESNIAARSFKIRDHLRRDRESIQAALNGTYTVPEEYLCRHGCSLCVPVGSDERVYDVTTLHKGAQLGRDLRKNGIDDIRELPVEGIRLTKKQRIQIEAVQRGARYTDTPQLNAFLQTLRYPLFLLAFEAYAPSIPSFEGLGPYEHVPVIVSLHRRRNRDAPTEHDAFAASPGLDERARMFTWLQEKLGREGSIVVFGKGFETSMITQLAAVNGDVDGGAGIIERFVDLLTPFSEFFVYDPRQRGKVSLKRLLPVYTETGYEEEAVQDGMHANLSYGRHADARYGAERRRDDPASAALAVDAALRNRGEAGSIATIDEIIAYCSIDTIALVRLLDRLGDYAGAGSTWTPVID